MPLVGCETAGSTPECESLQDCDDANECTEDACTNGLCDSTPVADGTVCGNAVATCQQGSCTAACSEQGIRDVVAAGGGPYIFDCAGPTTVVTEATIEIGRDVILDGDGNLTVDGDGQHRVFAVAEGVTAELRGLTVARGATTSPDGGGGIYSRGRLTLTDSTVSENSTDGHGGGISNSHGALTLTNSTVSGNSASGDGDVVGGIYSSGALTLTNSTVSGNSGSGEHAVDGIFNLRDSLTLTNSTVFDDIFAVGPGSVTSTATLIVGGCGEEWPYDAVTWVSKGYNVTGWECNFDQPTDQVNVSAEDLKLGPLQDNGGPTMTHALLPGSVAIDAIPADLCEVDEDQRGFPRDSMCDVGAFELQP
jgi:hypothetical protein